MSRHGVTVMWDLEGGDFAGRQYSRRHRLLFEGGVEVAGSASPSVVDARFVGGPAVDPEAAFIASLSACHMLWFLDLAARDGWVVEAYRDDAQGTLGRTPAGRMAMTRVELRPAATFSGHEPTPPQIAALHHAAHEACFIANSVSTEVVISPA